MTLSTKPNNPDQNPSTKLDNEIALLLGLVLRQFVETWYRKISDSNELITQISLAFGQMVDNLKLRASQADLDQLLLDDLPLLIANHIKEWRFTQQQGQLGLVSDPVHKFTNNAHIALKSEQLFLKLLSRNLVECLLDDENKQSDLAKSFCATIVNDILLKNAIARMSEPWFIHEMVIKLSSIVLQGRDNPNLKTGTDLQTTNLASLTASLSHMNHPEERSFVPLPNRSIFSAIAALLNLEFANPLLQIAIYLLTIPFRFGAFAKYSSRVCSELLALHVLQANFVAVLCQAARQSLFPNDGFMGPPRIIPTAAEQEELKNLAEIAIVNVTPSYLVRPLLGDNPRSSSRDILEPFQNKEVNKVLVCRLLDCIVLTLVPELQYHS